MRADIVSVSSSCMITPSRWVSRVAVRSISTISR